MKNIDDMTPKEIRKLAESYGMRAAAPIAVLKKRIAEKLKEEEEEAPKKGKAKAAPAKAAPVKKKSPKKPEPEEEEEDEEELEEEVEDEEEDDDEEVEDTDEDESDAEDEDEEEDGSEDDDSAVEQILAALDDDRVKAKILSLFESDDADESEEEDESEVEEEESDDEESDEEDEEEGEEEEADEALEALPEEVRSFFVSAGVDDDGDPTFDLVLDVEQIDDLSENECRALLSVLGQEEAAAAKGVRRLQVALRKFVEENNKQSSPTELKKDQKVTYTHSNGEEYEAWIAGPEWVTKDTGKVPKGMVRVYFEDESWDDVALSTISA